MYTRSLKKINIKKNRDTQVRNSTYIFSPMPFFRYLHPYPQSVSTIHVIFNPHPPVTSPFPFSLYFTTPLPFPPLLTTTSPCYTFSPSLFSFSTLLSPPPLLLLLLFSLSPSPLIVFPWWFSSPISRLSLGLRVRKTVFSSSLNLVGYLVFS